MALLDEQAYVGYPQMGRRRAMPNRDVEMNQGLLRGASYYPTDLLGAPVDLINMALKPMGLGSQKPVMGSDYLQSLAQQYGLSQQPTGSNAENVARLAMSAMNPATGARAVGKVIEPTMQALAPKAYGLLEDYMVKSGGMIPLTAYHGTPHNIQGKFDISKVGTGEGAQAYGHGMYFAENPGVASGYAKTLGQRQAGYEINGIRITPERGSIEDMAVNLATSASGVNAKNPFEYAKNRALELKKQNPQMEQVAKKIEELQSLGVNLKTTGNLYKVDIPDKHIPNMLDWDLPINQQSAKVQELAKQLDPNLLADTPHLIVRGQPRHWTEVVDKIEDLQNPKIMKLLKKIYGEGAEVMPYGDYLASKMTGEQLYRNLSNPTQWSKEAAPYAMKAGMEDAAVSARLNELGIKGIRYKDAMSRGADEGTSNFVVFDPSTVKILEKNNNPIEGLLD